MRPTDDHDRPARLPVAARALAMLLESRQITIPEMSTVLRVTPFALADVLAGQVAMPAEMAARIRTVFGVDVEAMGLAVGRDADRRRRAIATAPGVN